MKHKTKVIGYRIVLSMAGLGCIALLVSESSLSTQVESLGGYASANHLTSDDLNPNESGFRSILKKRPDFTV